MDKLTDMAAETANAANEMLPLFAFYDVLKKNGFPVTPLQIINANRIVLQYAAWAKNEEELGRYLTPVFAGSEDEQVLFKKLFTEHFARQGSYKPSLTGQKPALETRIKKNWKKIVLLYAMLAMVIIAIIVRSSADKNTINPYLVKVLLADKKQPDNIITSNSSFRVQTNKQLDIAVSCSYGGNPSLLELQPVFDWGDNSVTDALPSHIYTQSGDYLLKIKVVVLYKNDTVKKVFFSRKVLVCPNENNLSIKVSKNKEAVTLNESVRFYALLNREQDAARVKWTVDGADMGSGKQIQTSFKTAGQHSVRCYLPNDSNAACTTEKYLYLTIQDPNAIENTADTIKPAEEMIPGQKNSTDIAFLYKLYSSLAVIFFLLLLSFVLLWLKELKKTGRIKSVALSRYKKLAAALGKDRSPAVLPFKNRNYLPVDELDIDAVAKQMRRRVKDSSMFLHIQKTIAKTIEQGGLAAPVTEPRTRQSEYLILIDEYNSDSAPVKLFEYLAFLFRKHNVLVEIFYYKKEPALVYNINEPSGIHLEKMYGKYQRHILLIFGNGYQLVDTAANDLNSGYRALLSRWQQKAVVTPVSFIDWKHPEKNILLPNIPLLPMDMQGLALLAELLSGDENSFGVVARLRLAGGVFYRVAGFDFTNAAALLQYCNRCSWATVNDGDSTVNILFEWVAALAIYPVIRWEILLAVGKVILEKYGKGKELNYTALLRLVRIEWMKEGKMPGSLRLELLKMMRRENELLARETILQLLKEIPGEELAADESAFAEREIQQVINEFSLYAADPVYYSSYRQSKYVFEKLWNNRQLNDAPLEEYLKNSRNDWQTVLNNHHNGAAAVHSGVEQYLLSNEKEETLLGKVYMAMAMISVAVFVTSLLALHVLYIWENFSSIK